MEQMKTKTKSVYGINHDDGGNKILGPGTNQDYVGNKKTHFVEQIISVYGTKIMTTIKGTIN
jgi:hypothetical protein